MKLKIEPIQIGVAGEYLAATEISWALTKKAEEYFSENHVYIFVAIKGIGREE